MFFKFFILFAVMSIAEIAVLVQVTDAFGGWTTLFMVIFTAIVGAQLVRAQGVAALAEIRQKSATGQLPAESITEGIMILIAGILLVTPGFITDGLGLLLTMPITRKPFASLLVRQLGSQIKAQGFAFHAGTQSGFHSNGPFSQDNQSRHDAEHDSTVIEGEWHRKDDKKNLLD